MPELPEVETMRRGLLPIVGSKVLSAERAPCSKRLISIVPRIDVLNRRLSGRTVVEVGRLGKRVVLRFADDQNLIFEPRMTGIVLIGTPPNREHLRFKLKLRRGRSTAQVVLFWDQRGLGRIELLTGRQYADKANGNKLGPDAMSISLEELRQRSGSSRREIKVALLDQKLVAGVGNLYAAEILHLAGMDPRARCHRLKLSQWKRIYDSMQEVLRAAIKYEGSTLSDGTYQKAIGEPGGYQNHHRVYDRAEQLCLTCQKANIRRIIQSQRSTFFCPFCQTKR